MRIVNCALLTFVVCVASISLWSQATRHPTKDREAIIALEQEWLHASNAATLDRILASDLFTLCRWITF
jgi:hypothetical protein